MKKLLIIFLFVSIILNAQDYNAWITKSGAVMVFNGMAAVSPAYNENAAALFAVQYDALPFTDKQLISDMFDMMQDSNVYDKMHLFYNFASYSDSSVMHNWITPNDYTISFDSARAKPNFFKYSGIESITYDAPPLYSKTGYNMNDDTELIGDSMTVGLYIDDVHIQDDVIGQVSADGTPFILTQIGREGGVKYNYLNSNQFASASAITPLTGLYNFRRDGNTFDIINGTTNYYNNVRTYAGKTDADIILNAFNDGGDIDGTAQNTISFFYVADYLSDSEISIMNNIISWYFEQVTKQDMIYENDYVYYKYHRGNGINSFPIIWQKNNQRLCAANDTIYLSLDGGGSYPYKQYYGDIELIRSAIMSSNNNLIVTSTENELHQSLDSLSTLTEIFLQNTDSTNYVFHTPVNPAQGGFYFNELNAPITFTDYDNQEFQMWGSYGDVVGGAASSILFYSADTLKTLRVATESGLNPYRTDIGGSQGGLLGDTLGDPNNEFFWRHIHSVGYSQYDSSVYYCVGDNDEETKWFKGQYNKITDKWAFDTVVSWAAAGRFKSAGIIFEGDTIIFGGDDTKITADNGVFKCHIKDLADISKHIQLLDVPNEFGGVKKDGDNIIAFTENDGITVSNDNGETWSVIFTLDNLARNKPVLYLQPAVDGWFSLSDISQPIRNNRFGSSILIKIK